MDKKVKINECVEYKNKKFNIELEYYYDEELEDYYTDVKLGNENLRKIRNEYRRLNGLLKDFEIKRIRDKYDLSQKDFALLLGFGEVTITRYESKTVQDMAQNEIIKNAKDAGYFYDFALKNKEKFIKEYDVDKFNKILERIKSQIDVNSIELVYNKNSFSSEFTGNEKLNLNKIYAIIGTLATKINNLTKTKLAKLMWYVDFLFYKDNGKSITGLAYCHLPFGAYPFMFDEILNDKSVVIETTFNKDFVNILIKKCNCEYKLLPNEANIIDKVIQKFEFMNSEEVVRYMHKEIAYIETQHLDYISYEYAKKITL